MHCILERVIVHFNWMKHCGEQTNPIFKLFMTPQQYMTFLCHGGDGRAMVGLVIGDDTQGQGQGEDQEGP